MKKKLITIMSIVLILILVILYLTNIMQIELHFSIRANKEIEIGTIEEMVSPINSTRIKDFGVCFPHSYSVEKYHYYTVSGKANIITICSVVYTMRKSNDINKISEYYPNNEFLNFIDSFITLFENDPWSKLD